MADAITPVPSAPPPPPPPPPEVFTVRDPLSELTRKERRALLTASAIGLTITTAGILPTKVSALGIEFSITDQASLLWAGMFVILYFLYAFVSYSVVDYTAAGLAYREAVDARNRWREECKALGLTSEDDERFLERWTKRPEKSFLRFIAKSVSSIRQAVDFFLPIIVAGFALTIIGDAARKLDPTGPHLRLPASSSHPNPDTKPAAGDPK